MKMATERKRQIGLEGSSLQ